MGFIKVAVDRALEAENLHYYITGGIDIDRSSIASQDSESLEGMKQSALNAYNKIERLLLMIAEEESKRKKGESR